MRFVSIASGSSGNCIYTGTEESHILIDAGISAKRIEQGLNEVGLKTSELDGICITHEHSDHVKGLGVLARKYEVPIYATEGTLNEIKNIKGLGEYPEELLHPILPDTEFTLGDLTVKPFHIDHDAADPVAYRIQSGNKSVAVATDLGHFNQYTIDHLQDAGDGTVSVLLKAPHHGRFRTSFQRKRRASLELHFGRQIETHITRSSEQGEQYAGTGVRDRTLRDRHGGLPVPRG